MDDHFPVEGSVFVLKEGRKLGPFDVDEILDGLEEGDFSYEDICLREGATECERLKDLLDWEPDSTKKKRRPDSGFPPVDSAAPPSRIGSANPLSSDELLYAGHPSILCYPGSLLSVVLGATAGAWLIPFNTIFSLASFAISVSGLAFLSLMRFTSDYQIMPKRIEVMTGLIARSSTEVRVEDVRAINVRCRGISGMLGIGTVDFFTTGDAPEITFHKIWAANKVKALVRRLQDA